MVTEMITKTLIGEKYFFAYRIKRGVVTVFYWVGQGL